MTPDQLRQHIIAPVLIKMDMWSQDAEDLVLATAIHESDRLKRITQYGKGPALSYYQIEPATMQDLYDNWLAYRSDKKAILDKFLIPMYTKEDNLLMNLPYATAVCRLHYRRVKEPIPVTLEGKAHYWKKYYNTVEGKGTVEEFIKNVQNFI